jgi:hypothetical protein
MSWKPFHLFQSFTCPVRDVCLWISYIGLGQYKNKFLHNMVDGRILLMISDMQLKKELGIGPMGHRVLLLHSIEGLSNAHEDQSARSAGHKVVRPSSARPMPPGANRPTSEYPRRPASASRAVIPPDQYLGPAAGKVGIVKQIINKEKEGTIRTV